MKEVARLMSPQDLKKIRPGLLRGPILYGAVYVRPLPSQFIMPRPSPLSNVGSIQVRGHVACVVLADFRFVSHYGHRSDILRRPTAEVMAIPKRFIKWNERAKSDCSGD